jgi:hypothetical protein
MLTDRGRKYMTLTMEMAQGRVDEQVLACCFCTTAGTMASMGVGLVSPLAGMLMRRSGKKKAEGLPYNVLLVATPTKIHVFGAKPKRGKMAPDQLEQTWNRNEIQVATEEKTTATRLTINFPQEGRQILLDATKGSGGMFEEFLRYLMDPGLTHPA